MVSFLRTQKRVYIEEGFYEAAERDGKNYRLSDDTLITDKEYDSLLTRKQLYDFGVTLYEELHKQETVHTVYIYRFPA